MKFDHDVKLNGVWYKAGTEIPVSANASAPENKKIEDEPIVVVEESEIEEESKPTKRAYNKKKAE